MPKNHPTVEDKPLTQRQQQALVRREQLLDVALRLFSSQGFAATPTKQIAKEAGVAEGLVFHYFPSKVDILKALAGTRNTFAGEVQALLEGVEEQPAREVLRGLATGWVSLVRQEGAFLSMLLAESQTNPELETTFREVVGSTVGKLAGYLTARAEAGELRAGLEVHSAALMFFSPLIVFFITRSHLSDAAWRNEASAFVEEMLEHWFVGATAPEGR